MKKKPLLALILTFLSASALSAGLESKSDHGRFAISLAGACELMENRGVSGEQLSAELQKGMDKESADLLVNYSAQWIAKNPGKPCEQVYIDIIDSLEKKNK